MRNSLTAIGRGSTIVGLLLVLAGSRGAIPALLLAGQILIGVGVILLFVQLSSRRRG
jgi:hypothetical protein